MDPSSLCLTGTYVLVIEQLMIITDEDNDYY